MAGAGAAKLGALGGGPPLAGGAGELARRRRLGKVSCRPECASPASAEGAVCLIVGGGAGGGGGGGETPSEVARWRWRRRERLRRWRRWWWRWRERLRRWRRWRRERLRRWRRGWRRPRRRRWWWRCRLGGWWRCCFLPLPLPFLLLFFARRRLRLGEIEPTGAADGDGAGHAGKGKREEQAAAHPELATDRHERYPSWLRRPRTGLRRVGSPYNERVFWGDMEAGSGLTLPAYRSRAANACQGIAANEENRGPRGCAGG